MRKAWFYLLLDSIIEFRVVWAQKKKNKITMNTKIFVISVIKLFWIIHVIKYLVLKIDWNIWRSYIKRKTVILNINILTNLIFKYILHSHHYFMWLLFIFLYIIKKTHCNKIFINKTLITKTDKNTFTAPNVRIDTFS